MQFPRPRVPSKQPLQRVRVLGDVQYHRVRVHKVRRLGNSIVLALPHWLTNSGFHVGAEILIVLRDDGSLLLAPTSFVDKSETGPVAEGLASMPTPTSIVLQREVRRRRVEILRLAFKAGVTNVRIAGAVTEGTAEVDSPLEFVVGMRPLLPMRRSREDRLLQFREGLEALLERPVIVFDEVDIPRQNRDPIRDVIKL